MSSEDFNFYPLWHKEFRKTIKIKLKRFEDAERALKNKDFIYAKNMQKMIDLYKHVLDIIDQHDPNNLYVSVNENSHKEKR